MVTIDPSASENGLAVMLAQLIEENLKDPQKKGDFEALSLRLGIVAVDADVRVTLVFGRGSLVLYNGLLSNMDVVMTTTSEKVTGLSMLPIKRIGPISLPDFLAEPGLQMLRDIWRGDLKIQGLLRHPIAITRLTRLFSVVQN